MFDYGKWIYANCIVTPDQYTEYHFSIQPDDGDATLFISADSDYTLFVNNTYVASSQYGDFLHYKIYDKIDLSSYLTKQECCIRILLYYCGTDTQRYRREDAGVIFELWQNGACLAKSDEHILSRIHPSYVSGQKRLVSRQLGYTFSFDATKVDDGGFSESILVNKMATFFPRPIKKHKVLPPATISAITKTESGTYLIDLGKEVVGFLTIDFFTECAGSLCIAWGESLDAGHVRKIIHQRNFFIDYHAKTGHNTFTDYMLRLGCRYLEVETESPIDISYIGIMPQVYTVEEKRYSFDDPLENDIYHICVNTLRLCLMEHYVDTPWREQCLYAFDSRNQMLCGYYAFRDGNRDYARASLALLGEDKREDGLLSICAPSGTTLAIPTFSLYYILAMKEYLQYTADPTLCVRYAKKMEGILNEFLSRRRDGLVCKFEGQDNWNFYDWSPHLSGTLRKGEDASPDLVINCLTILALDAYSYICENASLPFPYASVAEELQEKTRTAFIGKDGSLSHHIGTDEYTTLGNALAILSGVLTDKDAICVAEHIVKGHLTPSSLSMNIFKYDALMLVDTDRYRDFILDEIRDVYSGMLACGATTVWETAEGSRAFDNAGSLCHGWSAVPVYIYHKLLLSKS